MPRLAREDAIKLTQHNSPQMEPQVFYSVCYNDKSPPGETQARHTFSPAVLHGYCRRRVRHADYPGMTEDPDHSVFGSVVSGITKANLEKLDFLSVPPAFLNAETRGCILC